MRAKDFPEALVAPFGEQMKVDLAEGGQKR